MLGRSRFYGWCPTSEGLSQSLRVWSSLECSGAQTQIWSRQPLPDLFRSGYRSGENSNFISLCYISCVNKPFTSSPGWNMRSSTVNLPWLPLKIWQFSSFFVFCFFFFPYLDVVMVALSALSLPSSQLPIKLEASYFAVSVRCIMRWMWLRNGLCSVSGNLIFFPWLRGKQHYWKKAVGRQMLALASTPSPQDLG